MSESLVLTKIAAIGEPTANNFSTWTWGLTSALRAAKVWDPIFAKDSSGRVPQCPEESINAAGYREYQQLALKACGHIVDAAGYTNSSITDPYDQRRDPVGMLNAITAKYAEKTSSTRFASLSNQLKAERNMNEDWVEYITRLRELQKTTQRLRPDHYTVEDLDSEVLLFTLVHSLDASSPFVTSLLANPHTSFDTVADAITRTYHVNKDAVPGKGSAPISSANAATIIEEANAAYNSIMCFWCEKPGHPMAKCTEAQAAKKLWLASKGTGSSSGRGGNRGQRGGRGSRGGNRRSVATHSNDEASAAVEFAGNASTTLSPSEAPPNDWTVDSGASSSMTPRREWVHSIVPDRRGVKLADGSIIWSEGRGVVTFKPLINGKALKP
ncbi:hypothetical protein M408DRAFT_80103, partial [Serendipita vermifera MAFF 305830]